MIHSDSKLHKTQSIPIKQENFEEYSTYDIVKLI